MATIACPTKILKDSRSWKLVEEVLGNNYAIGIFNTLSNRGAGKDFIEIPEYITKDNPTQLIEFISKELGVFIDELPEFVEKARTVTYLNFTTEDGQPVAYIEEDELTDNDIDQLVTAINSRLVLEIEKAKEAGERLDIDPLMDKTLNGLLKELLAVTDDETGEVLLPSDEEIQNYFTAVANNNIGEEELEFIQTYSESKLFSNNLINKYASGLAQLFVEKNDEGKGLKQISRERLSDYGIYTKDAEVVETAEDGLEKDYTKGTFEQSFERSISRRAKAFLSNLTYPDTANKKDVFGNNQVIPYQVVMNVLMEELSDVPSFAAGIKKLYRAYQNTLAQSKVTSEKLYKSQIISGFLEKLEKETLKAYNQKTEQGIKEKVAALENTLTALKTHMSMISNSFIGAQVNSRRVGKKNLVAVSLYNAHTARAAGVLKKKWIGIATTEEVVNGVAVSGLYEAVRANQESDRPRYEPNQAKLKRLKELASTLINFGPRSFVGDEEIKNAVEALNILGVDINEDILKSAAEGVVINNKVYAGGALFGKLFASQNGKLSQVISKVEEGAPWTDNVTFTNNLIELAKQYQHIVSKSFISGEGKSIYPINLPTYINRLLYGYKNYGSQELSDSPDTAEFMRTLVSLAESSAGDPSYRSFHKNMKYDWFLNGVVFSKFFRDSLGIRVFDVFKQKFEKDTSKTTYETMADRESLILDYNAFLDNTDKGVMHIPFHTLGGRDKKLFLRMPRISTLQQDIKGERMPSQAVQMTTDQMLRDMVVQDIVDMAAEKVRMGTEGFKRVKNYHTAQGYMKFSQATLLNSDVVYEKLTTDLEALIEFYTTDDQALKTASVASGEVSELIDKFVDVLKTELNKEVSQELDTIRRLNIDKNIDFDNTLNERYEDLNQMVNDYVISNFISKAAIRKYFAGGKYGQYKNIFDFYKRADLLGTPGYEGMTSRDLAEFYQTVENNTSTTLPIETYSSLAANSPTFTMGVIEDFFYDYESDNAKAIKDGLEALKEFTSEEGKESIDKYIKTKGANIADGFGMTSLDRYRKMTLGTEKWTPSHQKAYEVYNSNQPLRNKNGSRIFGYTNDRGKIVKPLLMPQKTFYDGMENINGKMLRVTIKHSTYPLIDEFTDIRPEYRNIQDRLEGKGVYQNVSKIDEINTASAVKVGSLVPVDSKNAETFKSMPVLTLNSSNQRIPQFIPEAEKKTLWGSQISKQAIANLGELFESMDKDFVLETGIYTAKEVYNFFQKAYTTLLDNNYKKFKNKINFDQFSNAVQEINKKLESLAKDNKMATMEENDPLIQKYKEAKKDMLERLKVILSSQIVGRNLSDNYRNALEIAEYLYTVDPFIANKTGYNLEVPTVDFKADIASSLVSDQFESMLYSLFTNNVFDKEMNGGALVQIPDIGGTVQYADSFYKGEVKEGVSEIFESNPELADDVYESLGYFKATQQKFETPEEFEKRTGRRMKMWEYMEDIAPDDAEITEEQKQQAQQKFQEYVNATGKQDIEGFKEFVSKANKNTSEGPLNLKFFSPGTKKVNGKEITIVESAEIALSADMLTSFGIDADKVEEGLLENPIELIGYRIPTSDKNSTIPLKIKYILPSSMKKTVVVPGNITLQSGSDFDIDKLFLMVPNYTTEVRLKTKEGSSIKGELNDIFKSVLARTSRDSELSKKVNLTPGELKMLLENPGQFFELSGNFYLPAEQEKIAKAGQETLKEITRREDAGTLVSYSSKKVPYSLRDIESNSKQALENLIMDLTNSILKNPKILEQLIRVTDDTTLERAANFMDSVFQNTNEVFKLGSPFTDRYIEQINKEAIALVGYYATAGTGQTIRAFAKKGQDYLKLAPKYKVLVRPDSQSNVVALDDLTATRNMQGSQINKDLSFPLVAAVDNTNYPILGKVGFTKANFPVVNLLLSLGAAGTNTYRGVESSPNFFAAVFVNNPFIKRFINQYNQKPISQRKSLEEDFKSYISTSYPEYKNALKPMSDANVLYPLDFEKMVDDLLDNTSGMVNRENVRLMSNYLRLSKIGAALTKVNSYANADRSIRVKSSGEALELLNKIDNLSDLTLNPYIQNIDLIASEYPVVGKHYELFEELQDLVEMFFPYNSPMFEAAKTSLLNELGKESLTSRQHKYLNNDLMLLAYIGSNISRDSDTSGEIGGPLSSVFTKNNVNRVLINPNTNIVSQFNNVVNILKEKGEYEERKYILLHNLVPSENNKYEDNPFKTVELSQSFISDGAQTNDFINSFKELLNSNDPLIKKFGIDLIQMTYLTNGFNNQAGSLINMIPVESVAMKNLFNNRQSMVDYMREAKTDILKNSYNADTLALPLAYNNYWVDELVPTYNSLKALKTALKKRTGKILNKQVEGFPVKYAVYKDLRRKQNYFVILSDDFNIVETFQLPKNNSLKNYGEDLNEEYDIDNLIKICNS